VTPRFARDVERLLDGAIENHCCSLVAPEGCEAYGHDVEEWCGVCLLAHDVRELVNKHASHTKGEAR